LGTTALDNWPRRQSNTQTFHPIRPVVLKLW